MSEQLLRTVIVNMRRHKPDVVCDRLFFTKIGRLTIFGKYLFIGDNLMNKIGIIYLVTNKINGKKYVGKTVDNLGRRKSQHGCRGYALHNAIKKYGKDAFEWTVLCECSIKELDQKEQEFIKKYNSCVSDGGYGYNIQRGGNGAPYGDANPSKRPEVREKLRQAVLGERNPCKRPEVRKKISETQKGKPKSEAHKKAISKGLIGHEVPRGDKNWISKRFIITFPDGRQEIVKGLFGFCRDNGLSYERLRYAQKKNGVSTDGYRVELYNEHS